MQQTRGRVSHESKCTPTQIHSGGRVGGGTGERERSHGQQGCSRWHRTVAWWRRGRSVATAQGRLLRSHSDGSRLRKGLSHQCCGRRRCCVLLLLAKDTADDAPPTPERLGRRRPRRARSPPRNMSGLPPVRPAVRFERPSERLSPVATTCGGGDLLEAGQCRRPFSPPPDAL